jgi:hypothetical protein
MMRAHDHTAYDDAMRQAVRLAASGTEAAVYVDGDKMVVCAADERPHQFTPLCIAQRWDANTVQLRFAGARSEWVKTLLTSPASDAISQVAEREDR